MSCMFREVIHGSFQEWWIEPILSSLGQSQIFKIRAKIKSVSSDEYIKNGDNNDYWVGSEINYERRPYQWQKNSKMIWSGSNYVDLNYYAFNVRGDNDRIEQFSKFHDVDRLERIVSNLESAIDKSVSIDKNRHLYRYDGEGLGFDVREGEVVTLKGFQSTTYDKSLADNSRNYNDEIMEEMGEPKSAYVKDIYVPKGIKGMMMGGEECEYLLPPNTRLYCFSIDKENRRAKFIVLPT